MPAPALGGGPPRSGPARSGRTCRTGVAKLGSAMELAVDRHKADRHKADGSCHDMRHAQEVGVGTSTSREGRTALREAGRRTAQLGTTGAPPAAHQLVAGGHDGEPSVLYLHDDPEIAGEPPGAGAAEPAYFRDLNLDQVRDGVLAGMEDYALAPFFHARLHDAESVVFRQEIFRDLEDERLLAEVERFSRSMAAVRSGLERAATLGHAHQETRWHLDAARTYVDAVRALEAAFDAAFDAASTRSRALRTFVAHLHAYVGSPGFAALADECDAVLRQLAAVHFALHLKGLRVSVRPYAGEPDYSAEVAARFERFRQGPVRDYRVQLRDRKVLDHVEAQILDRVARLFPAAFAALHELRRRWADFVDPVVRRFDREVQFYVAFLRWIAPLREAGLAWCYPEVSHGPTHVSEGFDAALAQKLSGTSTAVVTNDFELSGPERVLVVTGPNQGGKTTFARMWGQMHHLAAIGCPVPASRASLHLCDEIFTHFEREEDLSATGGKLEDDLVRVRDILLHATSESVLVLNEIFTSTTLGDAGWLGRKVIERIVEVGASCVYVTFVDELASLSAATVSMVSAVDARDPSIRTFEVVRRPSDGRSYALAIAEKYGLTYDQLSRRVGGHTTERPRR